MSQSKKKKIYLVLGAVVLAAMAVGAYLGRTVAKVPTESLNTGSRAAGGAAGDGSGLGELRIVKTYTRKDCSLAPWLIADKLGYFAEEGVKLVFTGEIQPPQRVPSLISGDNDVSDLHPNALAVAINGGAKLKGVVRAGLEPAADQDETFRHMWWFVNPEKYPQVKNFGHLKDIDHNLIFSVITTTSCSDFLANQILDRYGVPRDKVEWNNMPDVQAIQALKQGHTDVAGVHPPFYKGMLEAGMLKIADTQETGLAEGVAGLGFYLFREDFIEKNPEAVKGFARAMARAQKWINQNPEQARLWTQEAIGVPVSANHYFAEDLVIIDEHIEPWLKDLEDHGVIPKGKLSPQDLVVHDFEKYGQDL
ncbi:MAG: ABC transporter substrate-binding protein [Deltaproteobacteria bacterium]|jgi:ABC-type nitrate/sulfonate/bicarbonate transport system substrate-binding protein|nr:ABC transporter substrate-binding protein [Deltaproteobacteria bacterium]